MTSDRMKRRIDALLDEADSAVTDGAWTAVAEKARAVLAIEEASKDAQAFLRMAVANGVAEDATATAADVATASAAARPGSDGSGRLLDEALATVDEIELADAPQSPADPESFVGGRYKVLRFLGEGGKKLVYLAHDALLDRDIAFSLIKTEGLDDVGRERVMREAQAMGRLAHQNIVAIYDIGEHTAGDGTKQPYLVQELMGGGDVEGLLEDAGGPLALEQALKIGIATARGLEFAHAQDVIHRDLKPGNIWLTGDGVAKIGDLGLAVTLGQSRLTTHGMMVGTYGYMPPEQALGHEVTAQADLYSLGAMLYELVTGRPPFQGDTPTAVISQHLNAQPVAPSWHSDHCPPDLEALILRLLAKVPADRPASAGEVAAELEAIDPSGRSSPRSGPGANPLDRLAAGVFVGRERELEQLRSDLDAALQGRGGLVMLTGDPGIGKTRTAQELETYARMRGAEVYWGRTYRSAGTPAYWPWIQIGRAWADERDPAALGPELQSEGAPLVTLFPELRQILPELPEPHRVDNAAAQFRLFDAYSRFLRVQSAKRPWVVILDDLHRADRPTLELLQFIARELANMHLLVICTYRDAELTRTHPLSETLAELNRGDGFSRIALRGLERSEVAAYLEQRANMAPAPELADRLFEETEGNPFFLGEIVNLMTEEGTLVSTPAGAVSANVTLPDGVREALGRRLDRLSPGANELLQICAVGGREFAYRTLEHLPNHDAEAVLGLLEAAVAARVIEETDRPGHYRFTHALMQETLLAELSQTRQARLHGVIGQALEAQLGEDTVGGAALLARHFAASSSLRSDHTERACRYSIAAGKLSERSGAWVTATEHYEDARAALDRLDRPPDEQIDLLTALGRVQGRAAMFVEARQTLRQAITIARELSDARREGLAALELVSGFGSMRELERVANEAVEALGEQEPELRARLLLWFASPVSLWAIPLDATQLDQMHEAVAESRTIADEHGLADVRANASIAELALRFRGDDGTNEDRLMALHAEAEAVHRELDHEQHPLEAAIAAVTMHAAANQIGRLESWRESFEQQIAYTSAQHLEVIRVYGQHHAAGHALLRGNLEQAEELTARIPWNVYVRPVFEARLKAFRGDLAGAVQLLPDRLIPQAPEGLVSQVTGPLATYRLLLGQPDAARRLLDDWWSLYPEEGHGWSRRSTLASFARVIAAVGTDAQVIAAYEDLCSTQEPLGVMTDSLDWARGLLAARLDRLTEARTHLEAGLAWSAREGAPITAGFCHQALADVAEREADGEAARTHLDAAGALFSEHGAKLFLDQVIAKKEILKA